MRYPDLLRPTATEIILLPSGSTIEIPKATPTFDKWVGKPIEDTYGGKPLLNFAGEPMFAELVILRVFQSSNWKGVWVDTFKKKYRVGYWGDTSEITLPSGQELLLNRIFERAGTNSGCWDVFCWKGDLLLFAEAKRRGRDRIRSSQRQWLEAAIGIGLAIHSFMVVEWSVRE